MVVEHCVILAAGNGSRLREASDHKPLTHVGSAPLLHHALCQARDAGCRRAIVVVGHGEQALRGHLAAQALPIEVQVVVNPRYDDPNGVSLLAAEPYVADHFYVLMADHVFDRPVLQLLLAAPSPMNGGCRLLVDEEPHWYCEQDATKVMARGDRAVAIGKELVRWNRIDTGVFLMDRSVFDALRRVAARRPPSVTDAMRELIAGGLLGLVSIGAARWVDVDTPEDLAAACRLFADGCLPAVGDQSLAVAPAVE